MRNLPAVGETYQRKRDHAVIRVENVDGAWVEYRHGVNGGGRKFSVMTENFFTKYEKWPKQSDVAPAPKPSGGEAVTRSLRHRLARRGRSPFVWLSLPVVSPYTDRLQRAAFPGGCFYLVLPDTGSSATDQPGTDQRAGS